MHHISRTSRARRSFIVFALCCLLPNLCLAQSAADGFRALIQEMREYELQEDPVSATRAGDHRFNDRLAAVSVADSERRVTDEAAFLARLKTIDRDQLESSDRLNYDIRLRLSEDSAKESSFQSYLIPITNRSGFHISFPDMRLQVPLATVADYENYLSRLRAFRDYTRGHIELMQTGLDQRQTLPSIVLEGYEEPIESHIVDEPKDSLFFEPFEKFPNSIAVADQERLASQAAATIRESVVPAYREFLEFMKTRYVPGARGSIGASGLPNGREFYRHRVRKFTTLDLLPEEVHETGLSEVKRIRQEMEQIVKDVEFDGSFAEFLADLRTNPKFYATTKEQLLKEVAYVLKKMDGQLPKLFRKLPTTPYGIREIPEYIAPNTTTAYYMPPAGDGSEAGFYYFNTYNLKSRPMYEIEALSFHEAVPGHHLQIAIQQELDVPDFRRFSGFTAFIEGWALYSERLGLEVGFYTDPYQDFGRLTYEMWRACRLVVDTGIHYLGWTRQQAINFMAENTALSLHNIRAEVDRYISWPGQALGYKIGELKIRELRRMVETHQGDEFDVREFHDVILREGPLPLEILERLVKQHYGMTH